jgi:hypothetical protein
MLEHFTEDEIERMSAFTETPTYERTPEQLLPDDADDGDGDGDSDEGDAVKQRPHSP